MNHLIIYEKDKGRRRCSLRHSPGVTLFLLCGGHAAATAAAAAAAAAGVSIALK